MDALINDRDVRKVLDTRTISSLFSLDPYLAHVDELRLGVLLELRAAEQGEAELELLVDRVHEAAAALEAKRARKTDGHALEVAIFDSVARTTSFRALAYDHAACERAAWRHGYRPGPGVELAHWYGGARRRAGRLLRAARRSWPAS